jgi:hypothetical protein
MVGLVVNNELERMWKEAIMVLHWHLSGGTEVNLKVSDLRDDLRRMNQQFYSFEPNVSSDAYQSMLKLR